MGLDSVLLNTAYSQVWDCLLCILLRAFEVFQVE